jgi:two-component system, NtrC family, C4-dicarboxylate transport sensor histidine kinase DctB
MQDMQRMAELGRLSASLLHELSNPLSAVSLYLDLSDQNNLAIKRAKRSVKLMHAYIEAAKQQARRQSKTTSFLVSPQLYQLKKVFNPLAVQAGVRLCFDGMPTCRLFGDPVKLQQILGNLILNGIEAYGSSRFEEAMLVKTTFKVTPRHLIIQVVDWGRGIAQKDLPRIFEPFFTTKNSRQGLGIGLSMVKEYVTKDFNGSIRVSSNSRNGTRFIVKLPLI